MESANVRQDIMEKSFAEFVSRPENQRLVERAQQEEVEKKLKVDERLRFLDFKEQAEAAGLEVVQTLEPYLHHPVLRRLVTSFSNDAEGSNLAAWACNPRVQAILSRAKHMLEEGNLSDKELEYHMLQHLKAPNNPSSIEFKEKAQAVANLPTELLVGALNEHLAERSKACKALREGKPEEALAILQRALAIVNVVRGQQPGDQEEVVANKAATLRMLASIFLDLQQFGATVSHCTESLLLDPQSATAYMLRARARVMRREQREAEADIAKACSIDADMEDEADDLRDEMRALKAKDRAKDAQIWRNAFSRKT